MSTLVVTPQVDPEALQARISRFREVDSKIVQQVSRVIVGEEEVIEQVRIGLFVGGDCLITGLPGTAKTLLVRTMAQVLGLLFKRIQFTPDLMPTDITGTPPKTQSALLEAMQEHSCTVRGNYYKLPAPFFVLATQNPIELEGTYPLPEAQLDRFLFNTVLDYLGGGDELRGV